MLCELIDPQHLFAEAPPCPLQQPVLLALVQQLSADLSKKTDLKRRWVTRPVGGAGGRVKQSWRIWLHSGHLMSGRDGVAVELSSW